MTITISGTTGLAGVDGSAGTPSVQGADSNTGIFFPAADTVAIATGGTERARVDSSGNVGIGTSSPGAKLQVTGSSSNAVAVFDKGAANQAYTQLKNSSQSYSTYVDINNNGTNWLAQYDTTNAQLIDVYVPTSYRAFYTAGSERARIDSSGNLLVAKTSSSNTTQGVELNANGSCAQTADTTGDGPGFQFVNRNASTPTGYRFASFRHGNSATEIGTITRSGSSTVAYNTSSDYRLKHDIAPMTGALAKVAALKPVTYKWNVDDSDGEGFIAHELQAVVPQCVTGEKDAVDENGDPKYQGIDTSFLVATLTAAIQELTAKLDAAEARIAALEAK